MSRVVAVDRVTSYLLPPSVDEWPPDDHLARFVVEVIDLLDQSELTRKYAGRGSDAHHPAVLLGLLVYGYVSGVFSSRKIERTSYDTIATFRRRFLPQVQALLVQVHRPFQLQCRSD